MKRFLNHYKLFIGGLAGIILTGYIEIKIVMYSWEHSELDGKFGRLLDCIDLLQKLYLSTLIVIMIGLIVVWRLFPQNNSIRKNALMLLFCCIALMLFVLYARYL